MLRGGYPYNGLASCPGGVEILPVALFYRSLVSYAEFTFPSIAFLVVFEQVTAVTGDLMVDAVRIVAAESRFEQELAQLTAFI